MSTSPAPQRRGHPSEAAKDHSATPQGGRAQGLPRHCRWQPWTTSPQLVRPHPHTVPHSGPYLAVTMAHEQIGSAARLTSPQSRCWAAAGVVLLHAAALAGQRLYVMGCAFHARSPPLTVACVCSPKGVLFQPITGPPRLASTHSCRGSLTRETLRTIPGATWGAQGTGQLSRREAKTSSPSHLQTQSGATTLLIIRQNRW